MFPRPIQKASAPAQWVYTIALPVALFLWLRSRVHLGDDVGASHTEKSP